jgi:hypothetical protein
MAGRENENYILSWQPAVLGEITMAPSREHEFASAVFCFSPEQGMIRQQFQRATDAQYPFASSSGILGGKKFEQPFEIFQRSPGYFDARHDRARGRRTFFPWARAVK